jgi:hypothetical protein
MVSTMGQGVWTRPADATLEARRRTMGKPPSVWIAGAAPNCNSFFIKSLLWLPYLDGPENPLHIDGCSFCRQSRMKKKLPNHLEMNQKK